MMTMIMMTTTESSRLSKLMDNDHTMFEKDLNWDTVKKKITEAKIGDTLSSVKFEVSLNPILSMFLPPQCVDSPNKFYYSNVSDSSLPCS